MSMMRFSSSLSSSSVPLSLGSVPCLGMPGEINANEKWIEGEPRGVWHPAERLVERHMNCTSISKLVLKLLFPLHVSHKETKECEICDSVCGFVTCVPRLKMIEILVLAHFRLGQCKASFRLPDPIRANEDMFATGSPKFGVPDGSSAEGFLSLLLE
ncbi:hypothetical protein Q9966_007643 [Columba livia]|nr:hypothetical protein Q9966_007643 [Columba livia]